MAEDWQQWVKRFSSLMKRTPEGEFVVDESKVNEEVVRSLIESPPVFPTITIEECIARFGAFGVYRSSTADTESPWYAIYLGEISVPYTLEVGSLVPPNSSAVLVGSVREDKATREGVIEHLRERQEQERRSLDKHAAGTDAASQFARTLSADDQAKYHRLMGAEMGKRKQIYAKINAALKELSG